MIKLTNKKIKVILFKDVPNIGKGGTVVEVKMGFFRNYLEPSKCAEIATPKQIQLLATQQANLEQQRLEEEKELINVREKLNSQMPYLIQKRAREDGSVFGTITKKDILNAIQNKTGIILNTVNKVTIPEIEKLGNYEVTLVLGKNTLTKVLIDVVK